MPVHDRLVRGFMVTFDTRIFSPPVPTQPCKEASDNLRKLVSKERWHGIADLGVLLRAIAREEVVVRERLQSGGLPDREASALGRVVVDVVVAILRDVRNDGRGRVSGALHS